MKYEYLVKKREEVDWTYQEHFNLLGLEGWELILIDKDSDKENDDRFIFRRLILSGGK